MASFLHMAAAFMDAGAEPAVWRWTGLCPDLEATFNDKATGCALALSLNNMLPCPAALTLLSAASFSLLQLPACCRQAAAMVARHPCSVPAGVQECCAGAAPHQQQERLACASPPQAALLPADPQQRSSSAGDPTTALAGGLAALCLTTCLVVSEHFKLPIDTVAAPTLAADATGSDSSEPSTGSEASSATTAPLPRLPPEVMEIILAKAAFPWCAWMPELLEKKKSCTAGVCHAAQGRRV